jgi:hypothetical protein
MNAIETIPVTIEPEASARIAQLGFQEHLDRMIAHAKQTLPKIQRIEVELYVRYDEEEDDGVYVEVWSGHPYDPEITSALRGWLIRSFSPDVLRYLSMSCSLMGE